VRAALTAVVAIALLAPASALAKSNDFEYASTGKAVAFGAVAGLGTDGTFEDYPFTIGAGDNNGKFEVEVHWDNPADDWDLYIYRKNSTGELDQVGSSAGAPPSTTESTVVEGQAGPVEPGEYVVRVQNYSATSPNFAGSVKFSDYQVANVRPTAKLKVPKKATAGKKIKLDASGSKDSDGSIASYSWDLDGNGSFETNGGTSATLRRAFSAGVHRVGVRVVDDKGGKGYAHATVRATKKKKKRK
jgi:hypothetical protein